MVENEDYFPRGGKKPTVNYFQQSSNFLGTVEKTEKKKKKSRQKSDGDDGYLSDDIEAQYEKSLKNCAVGLYKQTLKEGLLVLGRVQQVFETKIQISLPSHLRGFVMACHISEQYNKLLEAYVNDQVESVRELSKMFRPGQYVAVRVLESNDNNITLSMMPQHVNKGRLHSDIVKGTLLQTSVSSVEDHGYVMDIGVANTRVFLPKNTCNPDIELDTGMLTWCTVKSFTPSTDNSIITVSNQLEYLQKAVTKRSDKVATLTPGTAVDFVVDKALDNGIEGRIFGDKTAYIQRSHTDKVKGKKPNLGQRIRARLLYELPTRKDPFLTMRNIFENTFPDLESEQKFKQGDFVEKAQVIKIAKRAIIFRLGKNSTGVMRIGSVDMDEDQTEEQAIAKSYPLGSEHKVRILQYHLSDFVYTVSDQSEVLKEQYFSLDRLSIGQLVEAHVEAVTEVGIKVQLGRLHGLVPKTHATDSGITDSTKTNIKLQKKFKEGTPVRGRVLELEPESNRLILTLKPSLVSEKNVLMRYEDAIVGQTYVGVIRYIKDYILVSFFNKVVAYVAKKFVSIEPIANLYDAFHVGQIVNCTIQKVDIESRKMIGSLIKVEEDAPKPQPDKKRKQKSEPEAPVKKQKLNKETELPKRKKQDSSSGFEDDTDSKESKNKKLIFIDRDLKEEIASKHKELIDLSDCVKKEDFEKRTKQLVFTINAELKKIDTIQECINDMEEKGLTSKNKPQHTKLKASKIIYEDRVKTLWEVLAASQNKLKEFSELESTNESEQAEKQEPKIKEKTKKSKKKNNITTDKDSNDSLVVNSNIKVLPKDEPGLQVPSAKGFWSMDEGNEDVKEPESSSDEEQIEQPKKKRKKLSASEKVAKAREEEERLRVLEREAIGGSERPHSVEQFERALLGEPNCSQLWVAYCAFHLQATEIEKARAVCRRAISTISFREEEERLNVWMAMINFELRFGTKETQQKALEEALQCNDTYKIHSKLLSIYVDMSKAAELSSLVDLMMKKYKRDVDTFVVCGKACYQLGLRDKARQVMQKAISVLEKKHHVTTLVQFALLERDHGERERAEALFEQILGVYPQRVDVCAVYADMLFKAGEYDNLRQVMERMTSHKMAARKMKVLYKKWIELEEKIGDESRVEIIREKAMEYIEKAKF